MRERDRTQSIQNKKLLRTTTFSVALLVVATMILSSAAPAININTKSTQLNYQNNGGDAAPLNTGDTNSISNGDRDIMFNEHHTKEVIGTSYNRAQVVWDNVLFPYAWCDSSQEDTAYPFSSRIADDFWFNNDGVDVCIDDVHWIGGYYNGDLTDIERDWTVVFYEDDGTGNKPGDIYAGPYTVSWDNLLIKNLLYQDSWAADYEFAMNIPEVCFSGCGEKYWVSIYGSTDVTFPQTAVGLRYGPYEGSLAMFKGELFGYPDWVIYPWGTGMSMCFQLTLASVHDVSVVEIVNPTDGMELCDGCLPVEVKATNYGKVDETNVPVHVQIFQELYAYDFEEGWWVGTWDQTYGADWNYDWGWYGLPAVVLPHDNSYYMMTLYGGVYSSSLIEAGPIDVSDACNPVVSFYMWHDGFGSDDYLQVTADGNPIGPKFYRLCCPDCPEGWVEHQVEIPEGTTYIGFYGYCDGIADAYPLHIDDVEVLDMAYDETTYVDIAVGETVSVPLPDYCLCQWQQLFNTDIEVYVNACTELATDEIPENDCLEAGPITIHLPFEHDVGTKEVVIEDLGCLDYEISGTIRNYGQFTECCFKVYADIYAGYYGTAVEFYNQQFESPLYGLPSGWSTNKPSNWQIRPYYYWNYPYPDYDNCLVLYYYPYGYDTYRVVSNPINTVGMGAVEIKFDHSLNHWSGPYDLYVETSSNGVDFTPVANWHNPTSSFVTYDETVETSVNVGSSTFYIAFTCVGEVYNLNYWCIDNLRLGSKPFIRTDHLFSEWYCVDEIAPCEEQTIDFGSFHPEINDDCGEVMYQVCIKTALCDPMDDNPFNDEKCSILTIPYSYDVELAITTPEPKADILFQQLPYGGTESWSAYTTDTGAGYQCYEDFWGLTGTIGSIDVTGLALIFTGYGWSLGDPYSLVFDVSFYEAGTTPGAQVELFEDLVPVVTDLGPYSWAEGYMFTIELPDSVDLTDGWMSVQSKSTGQGETWFLWLDSPTGDLDAMQGTTNLGDNLAFTLYKGGPSWKPEAWFPCGEQDICATVKNIGTFDLVDDPDTPCDFEGVTVLYDLWYVNMEDPCEEPFLEFVTEGSINIEIPCGEEEEVCFTYDFTESGIYVINFEAVTIPEDCDMENNADSITIGIDCCDPVAEHTATPLMPDGCNNWYLQDVTIKITAYDPLCPDPCLGTASGIKEIHYVINGVETIKADDEVTFKIKDEGVNLVEYWAVDNAGNVEDKFTFEIAIDKTKPTVEMFYEKIEDGTLQVKFTAAVFDGTSGVDKVEFYIGTELKETFTAPPFSYTVTWDAAFKTVNFIFKAYDSACNTGSAQIYGGDIDTVRGRSAQSQSQALSQALAQSQVATQQI